ncbi:hypothetical protein F5888DRAFT_1634183 [Russula emetica]|nr:hypothetical protein F5888DRAFT_1634183 [Russula emetica]
MSQDTPSQEEENKTINVKVVSSSGEEVSFKTKLTTKLSKLQGAYANKVGKDVYSIRFSYDGRRIDDDNTLASLEMEDNGSPSSTSWLSNLPANFLRLRDRHLCSSLAPISSVTEAHAIRSHSHGMVWHGVTLWKKRKGRGGCVDHERRIAQLHARRLEIVLTYALGFWIISTHGWFAGPIKQIAEEEVGHRCCGLGANGDVREPGVLGEEDDGGSLNRLLELLYSSSRVRKEGVRLRGASGIRSVNEKVSDDDVACDLIPLILEYNISPTVIYSRPAGAHVREAGFPHHPYSSHFLTSPLMSHNHSSFKLSNFQLIFNNALNAYKKRTKMDLLAHPLAVRLQACDSPSSILTVLQEQVQKLNESQRSNTEWLDPTVNVIHTFSETLEELEGVDSVFSPEKVIFIGFAVLLSTARDVRASQDALFDMFERVEAFFRRLDVYTAVAPNEGMMDTITAIMVEVLKFIGIVTKEIKQSRTKKYLNKLIGRTDTEDALKRLDRLTREEARMAAAQLLKVTNTNDNREGL